MERLVLPSNISDLINFLSFASLCFIFFTSLLLAAEKDALYHLDFERKTIGRPYNLTNHSYSTSITSRGLGEHGASCNKFN